MVQMKNDLYPGGFATWKPIITSMSFYQKNPKILQQWSQFDFFLGLEKSPKFLSDTMLPTISPEAAAAAAVLAAGGYDPCQFEVNSQ